MEKIRITDVVKFRLKPEGSRKTFIRNLQTTSEQHANGEARNYWVRSENTIKKTFKYGNPEFIHDKLNEIRELLLDTTLHSNTTKQYNHNITILKRFENFDFSVLKPSEDIKILPQRNDDKILFINDLPIESAPSFVYSFSNNVNDEVGAIWFVAQKDGFKIEELGMFVDILSRYLTKCFSPKYVINHKYCIAVDLYNGTYIDYSQIEEGRIPKILDTTISKIKDLL